MSAHKLGCDQAVPAVWVHRGQGIEAVHTAAVAVVDASSKLTHSLGDVEQVFFARSSIKPLQALPLVEAGGLERFGFGAEELALTASSHNGSDQQRALVAGMLQKLGLDASYLKCGCQYPLQLQLFGEYPRHGEDQDPLRHNCSGKHAGFLALAKLLGQPLGSYLEPDGPVQTRVRSAVADACEADASRLLLGTDGCSAPNFALALRELSIGIKNLVLAPSGARARVSAAMLAHPLLVSGERRLDYDFARAFPGRVVAKGGAEGMLLVGFREPALGIAIKVIDGALRALGPILVEVLRQLGLVQSLESLPTLVPYRAPKLRNARQLEVGELRAEFQLSTSTGH